MIGEPIVPTRQVILGHMTGHTKLFADPASRSTPRRSKRFALLLTMTGVAFCIIESRLMLKVIVRVVACQATDSVIVRVVAFAVGQTIRLESNVINALQAH